MAANEAKEYCEQQGPGWRIPALNELVTLVDRTTQSPAIDEAAFPGVPNARYWTTTILGDAGQYLWTMDFFSGVTDTQSVDVPLYVRCVKIVP